VHSICPGLASAVIFVQWQDQRYIETSRVGCTSGHVAGAKRALKGSHDLPVTEPGQHFRVIAQAGMALRTISFGQCGSAGAAEFEFNTAKCAVQHLATIFADLRFGITQRPAQGSIFIAGHRIFGTEIHSTTADVSGAHGQFGQTGHV